MPYLMESTAEARRLVEQEMANPSVGRLAEMGLSLGMRVADVGCGAGAQLGAMLELVGPRGTVVGLDPSAERLAAARESVGKEPRLSLVRGAVPATGLEGGSFDFVWSQFVLEYLADQAGAVAELTRLAKPGGRVVVSEIDGLGLDAWPMPEVVSRGAQALLPLLRKTGFDIHVGRKAFSLFRQAGLKDVRVRLWPWYVADGAADARLIADWKARFEALRPLGAPALGGEAAYAEFSHAALEMFGSPDSLKYAVLLVTSGVK